MKTKLLSCTWLLLLLLSGCLIKEDDFISKYCPGSCTVITGRLTTDDGNTPLSGVNMEAKWVRWEFLGGIEHRKAVATTDANGNYELRFLLRDGELPQSYNNGYVSVQAALDQSRYIALDAYGGFLTYDDLKRDTTLFVNYTFPQKAFVELQLRNTAAMQTGDRFTTQFVFSGGENNAQSYGQNDFWNSNAPASITVPVAANQQVIVRTSKTKNGVETVKEDTLELLQPGQHTRYEATF